MSFEITVIEYSAKTLVGTKVVTSMQKAQVDCPELWQSFGPNICEMFPNCIGVYGVSVMLNENDFEYWAAVEIPAGSPTPEGMATVEIPAGKYAKCGIPNVAKLGEAFMYIYGPWIQNSSGFTLKVDAPCFELYPSNWQPAEGFEVFVPVQ